MARKDIPFSTVQYSVFAILAIAVIHPLVVGSVISVATWLSDETSFGNAPDDHTGSFNIDSFSGTGSSCSWEGGGVNSLTVPTSHAGYNWTSFGGYGACTTPAEYVSFGLPSSVIPDPENETTTRLKIWISGAQSSSTTCNQDYVFDYELTVNGTEVFSQDGVEKTNQCLESGSNTHTTWKFNIELDAVGVVKFSDEVNDCKPHCHVVLNITSISQSGTSYQFYPYTTSSATYIKADVYTTDPETSGTVLTVAPYIITVVNLLIILASTPYWNPVRDWITGGVPSGA